MKHRDLVDLDEASLAIIESARGMHDPQASSRTRVRSNLMLSLGSGAAVSGYASSALATKAKLVAIAAAMSLAGGGAWYLRHRGDAHPPAVEPSAAREPTPVAVTLAIAPPSVDRPVTAAEVIPSVLGAARRPATSTGAGVHASWREDHTGVASAGRATSLAAETSLIGEANAALLLADGARALELLAVYDRRFKTGRLFAERCAERVLALCALGSRRAAAEEAHTFLARWPSSPVAERVATSCAAASLETGSPE